MTRYCYWGPVPNERDGGAIVNYYLLKKFNELRPMDEYYGVPKVPEELDPSWLPWVNYFTVRNSVEFIPSLMLRKDIPLLNIFHIGRGDIERVLEPVHNIGGKIVCHQTIHWDDDDILKSNRLIELDKIVAPTRYAYDIFKEKARLPPEKLAIIPHAVDTNRFYKHETILERRWNIDKKRQRVILFTGRLSYWKGVHQIIPIIRPLVRAFDCVFVIRGSAFEGVEESKKLAYIFNRLSVNNPNIIFISEWQPPAFMEELYAMTDVLIANSAHEGFNLPLIESQAVGAIPITTAIPNHVEILGRTGYCGILVEPRVRVGEVNDGRELMVAESDQLYGAVKWVLENPAECAVMGQHGIENVKKRFDLSKIAPSWLQLYDSLLSDDMNENMRKGIL